MFPAFVEMSIFSWFWLFYIILIEESLFSRLIPKSVLEQFYVFILQILLAKVMNYFGES